MRCIGIDVGGTYTDAAFIRDGQIKQTAKVPTRPENLVETLLEALDKLNISDTQELSQITVSTTLITNAILQKRIPAVQMFLFPGKGMSMEALPWPFPYRTLTGEIDFRGREVNPPDEREWSGLATPELRENPAALAAVVGKFSHRNSLHEEQLAGYLKGLNPSLHVALGHTWGQANFYRRSLSTYLDLSVSGLYWQFAGELQDALARCKLNAPLAILKADGGIVPLAKLRPLESVYSGPAASILGALTQSESAASLIVVDIGGTTTDIGLILSGVPLLSSKGAQIGPYATLVRALAVRSIPVGGDSVIRAAEQGFTLESYRLGQAACLGGEAPTPTDAMCYLGLIDYGRQDLAEEALRSLWPTENPAPERLREMAAAILDAVAEKIAAAVASLQREWREEPAYKVWEVLHPQEARNFSTLVTGGGARGLVEVLAQRLGTPVRLGDFPEVSNALGAALACPTFDCTLHLDTSVKRYRVAETGEQGIWPGSLRPHKEVEDFLIGLAHKQAASYGWDLQDLEWEKDPFDFFPIVQRYRTAGQIVRGAVHVRPGVSGRVMK